MLIRFGRGGAESRPRSALSLRETDRPDKRFLRANGDRLHRSSRDTFFTTIQWDGNVHRYFMRSYPISYVRYIQSQIVDVTCLSGH